MDYVTSDSIRIKLQLILVDRKAELFRVNRPFIAWAEERILKSNYMLPVFTAFTCTVSKWYAVVLTVIYDFLEISNVI
jgi:hypothetical protein